MGVVHEVQLHGSRQRKLSATGVAYEKRRTSSRNNYESMGLGELVARARTNPFSKVGRIGR